MPPRVPGFAGTPQNLADVLRPHICATFLTSRDPHAPATLVSQRAMWKDLYVLYAKLDFQKNKVMDALALNTGEEVIASWQLGKHGDGRDVTIEEWRELMTTRFCI